MNCLLGCLLDCPSNCFFDCLLDISGVLIFPLLIFILKHVQVISGDFVLLTSISNIWHFEPHVCCGCMCTQSGGAVKAELFVYIRSKAGLRTWPYEVFSHTWLSKWGHKAPQSSNEGSRHWVWFPAQVRAQAHTQALRLLSNHWWAAAASFWAGFWLRLRFPRHQLWQLIHTTSLVSQSWL